MAGEVKNTPRGGGRTPRTRVSAKHQITIPLPAFKAAGLRSGDTLRAEAAGPGRVLLTRQDEILDEFSGSLHGGPELEATLGQLRGEWA